MIQIVIVVFNSFVLRITLELHCCSIFSGATLAVTLAVQRQVCLPGFGLYNSNLSQYVSSRPPEVPFGRTGAGVKLNRFYEQFAI